jgi:hypothetical protein
MPDMDQSNNVASWVQAGGVVAFAAAVLWELKQLRPIMSEVAQVLAKMLERERMRAEQRAQLLQLQQGGERRAPIPVEGWDDTTDAVAMPVKPPKKRSATSPRGYPVSVYGPLRPPRDEEE